MRKVYKESTIFCWRSFVLLKKYRLSGEHAGLHVLLTSRNRRMRRPLSGKRRKGVRLYGLHEAALEPVGRPEATVLLGYAGLEKEEIKAGLHC